MPKYNIIIPPQLAPIPQDHEISAAIILANHFTTNVTFLERLNSLHSPDLKINNLIWEVKSPKGNGKRTMQNNLREADNQSPNIVIDLRRCKMHSSQAISRIKCELRQANKIKRLLVIKKNGEVLALK